MVRVSRLLTVSLLSSLATVACSSGPAEVPHHLIAFHAHADVDEPLAGVRIWSDLNGDRTMTDNEVLGTTDATGVVRVDHVAPYGTILNVAATCPMGYRPPAEMGPIALHPVQASEAVAAQGVEHTVQCLPINRDAVVVIRATSACASGTCPVARVPVLLDGREVGQTDDSGVAHVAVSKTPNSSFRLELAAATLNPMLMPPQATHDFVISDQDEIMAFEQAFTVNVPTPPRIARPHGPRRATRPPVRRIPSRIGARR